jgi:hypothetical protein
MPSYLSAPFRNDSNGTEKLTLAHGFIKLLFTIAIMMFCQGILFVLRNKS